MSSKPPPVPLELSSSAPSYEDIMHTARNQLQQRDLGSYEEVPLYFAWERLYAAANANCSTDWLEESHEAFQHRTQGRPMARQGLPPPPPTPSLKSRTAPADHIKRQSILASSFLRPSTLSPAEMSSLTRTYRENATKMKALRGSRSSPSLSRDLHIEKSSARRSHRTNALIHELELEAELDNRIRKVKAKKKRVKGKRISSSSSENEAQLNDSVAVQATSREAMNAPIAAPANMKAAPRGLSSIGQASKTAMSWDIDLSNPASSKTTSTVKPIAVWAMHERQSVQNVMPIKAVTSDQIRKAEATTQLQYPSDSLRQTGKEKLTMIAQVNLKSKPLDITQDSSFLSEESDEPLSPILVVGSSTRGSLRMSNSSFGSESIEPPSNFSSDESTHSPRQTEREPALQHEKPSGDNAHISSQRSSHSAPQLNIQQYRTNSDSTELLKSTRLVSQASGNYIDENEGYEEYRTANHQRGSQKELLQDRAQGSSSVMMASEGGGMELGRYLIQMSQQSTPNEKNLRDLNEDEELKEEDEHRRPLQSESVHMQTGAKYTETRDTTQTNTRGGFEQANIQYFEDEGNPSSVHRRSVNLTISAQGNPSGADLTEKTRPYRWPSTSQSTHADQKSSLTEGKDTNVNSGGPTGSKTSRHRLVQQPTNLSSKTDEANTRRRSTRSEHSQHSSTKEIRSSLHDEDGNHEPHFRRILATPEVEIQSIRSSKLRSENSIRQSSQVSENEAVPERGSIKPIVKNEAQSKPTRLESTASLSMQRDLISDYPGHRSMPQPIRQEMEESAYGSDEEQYVQREIPSSMNQGTPMPAKASGRNDDQFIGNGKSRKDEHRHAAMNAHDSNNKNVQDRTLRSLKSSEKQTRRETYDDDEGELQQIHSTGLIYPRQQQSTRSLDQHTSNSNVLRTTSQPATFSQNNSEFHESLGIRRTTQTTNGTANTGEESTQQHHHHHRQHRASQRSSSRYEAEEDRSSRYSTPMRKIFDQSQGLEQWTSDESEPQVRTSSRYKKAHASTSALTSTSSERSSRAAKHRPVIVWPPGMEGGMKGIPSSRHHPCAPPGMEHLVTDEQLSEYWTWLRWYSSWQIWYLKNERKSSKRRGRSQNHSVRAP